MMFGSRLRAAFLLPALLMLSAISPARAQEVCIGDQCTPPGSIYRYIRDLAVSGRISAGVLLTASSMNYTIVNTLADLRKATVPVGNTNTIFAAHRLGFNSAGDGGDAFYVWSQNASCTDDGGYCVKPSAGPGRWILANQGPYSPMIWGNSTAQFNIASGGSDTNVGDHSIPNYCLNSGTPCATGQQAANLLGLFAFRGVSPTIKFGAGTFTPVSISGSIMGTSQGTTGLTDGGAVKIIGAGSASTTIQASAGTSCGPFGMGVLAGGYAYVLLGSMTITTTCANGSDLFLQDYANASLADTDVVFGPATVQQIHLEAHAMWQPGVNFAVSGNAQNMIGVAQSGHAEVGTITITCKTAAVYSAGTMIGQDTGIVQLFGPTFSGCGGVTGARFNFTTGAVLNTGGNTSPTYIPGDSDGVFDTNSSATSTPGTVAHTGFIGSRSAPTDANTVLKTARSSTGTWAGFGTDNGLVTYVANKQAGVTTTQFEFYVSGQAGPTALASATANTLCYSDTFDSPYHIFATCSSLRALKDNIRDLPLGLGDIMKLRPREYWSKPSQAEEIGLVAEEVHDTVPLLSTYLDGKLNGVDYMHLTALLVKGMQQQQQQIRALFGGLVLLVLVNAALALRRKWRSA